MSDSQVSTPGYVPNSAVRHAVRSLLLRTPSFLALPPDRQIEVARDTVMVADYITRANGVTEGVGLDVAISDPARLTGGNGYAAPAGALAGNLPGIPAVARQPAATVTRAPAAGTSPVGTAQPITPQAAQPPYSPVTTEGVQDFGALVQTVDFPKFCSGLIEGVFTSIVNSSIKQMEAYGELVKNVAKSADEYMKDNVTENQARDYLADRYPEHLQVDISKDTPKLKVREGADDEALPDFFKDLGLTSPVQSLDDDTAEQTLVPAARKRIAMDKQQLLATMVMMGINRIVVTDGHIEASVLFELDTSDVRTRRSARTSDRDDTHKTTSGSGHDGKSHFETENTGDVSIPGIGTINTGSKSKSNRDTNWYGYNTDEQTTNFKVHTMQSTDSEQKIDMHAKLGGKVRINFKSDYLPMDKFATPDMINAIMGRQPNAAPIAPAAQAAPAPTAAPAGSAPTPPAAGGTR